MRPDEVALSHYADRLALQTATGQAAATLWRLVNPQRVVDTWRPLIPRMTAIVAGAQLAAARQADPYVTAVLDAEDLDVEDVSPIEPRGFAGTASDGRGLATLLENPAFTVLTSVGGGASTPRAMAAGAANLDMMVRTQVADAGRAADQVALTARPAAHGYVRMAVGNSCARCLLLSGRIYDYNAGFQRHPRCDCIGVPVGSKAAVRVRSSHEVYDRMTARERSRAGFSKADQKAIADGADLGQVVNAKRGMYTAGGRHFTTEGTTRSGLAGQRLGVTRGRPVQRLTPDQIYREAADRDEALALLYRHGYLVEEPAFVQATDFIAFPKAAAATTDPALKMTVAEIKQAAADAGVKVIGTRKADILANLRSWEVGNRRIPGLPEFKPPTIRLSPPAVPAPPPLRPPPVGKPELSGSALNDWSDEFKYDQQYGRHQFVNAAGDTAAEGVRVSNLRTYLGNHVQGIGDYTVATGTAWRFDGVAYLIEHDASEFGSPWVSRMLDDLRSAHASIPAAARATHSYTVLQGESPANAYWAKRFNNPTHTGYASAGNGNVDLWGWGRRRAERVDIDSLVHETGHNLDNVVGRLSHGSESHQWGVATDADAAKFGRIKDLQGTHVQARDLAQVDAARGYPKGVTRYGRSSAAEDYAESVMLYQAGPIATGKIPGVKIPVLETPPGAFFRPVSNAEVVYFRDIYPERAKILDQLFPDIARKQKAEIKALRTPPKPAAAPKPPTVAALRAEAKARNIKIPVGSTRADIERLLAAPPPDAAALKRAAARERNRKIEAAANVEQVLAELDELLLKNAGRAALEQTLSAAMDAKDLAALRAALDDKTKLRAAIARISKKNGIGVQAKAGAKVKYDPTLHDPLGAVPAEGAQMVVVRRGTTVTIDGDTIRLNKATVTTPPTSTATKATAAKVPTGVESLPRKSGKAETAPAAARATNPQFGTTEKGAVYSQAGKAGQRWVPSMGPLPSGAFEENCTNVVYAFEMRMRGFDVQAAPLDVLDRYGYAAGRTYKETDQLLADGWRLPNGSPHGRTFASQQWRSFAEIDREIESWPAGGRGFVTVGKHVFNVVNQGGKAQYIEAQFNANASRVVTSLYKKKYRGSTIISETPEEAKLVRLDDLVPTDGILEAVRLP